MIEVERSGGLLTLRLNRPDKANSLTAEMLTQIRDALTAATAPRALIITGMGDKVFSAGADLDEARAGLALSPLWEEVSGAIAALPCLTIAALNGTLAGGAFGMALACDLRIAVPKASFFYPVARLGFLPQPSDPDRLRALVGPARTKHLLLSGARWTAEQALQFGLIDDILEPHDLMAEARKLATHALEGKADVLHQIKAMSNGA